MKTPENSKTNLDDLIQKIKSEGVEEAERRSEKIINAARLTASKILDKAGLDAEAITKEARLADQSESIWGHYTCLVGS